MSSNPGHEATIKMELSIGNSVNVLLSNVKEIIGIMQNNKLVAVFVCIQLRCFELLCVFLVLQSLKLVSSCMVNSVEFLGKT